jgi:hypothetical protein
MGCCVPVVANADAYYTKSEIDEKIDDIASSGCCITPEEVDEKISNATDGLATEQWVEDKHYITSVDLSDYALKEEIPDISGYATEQWVNDQGFLKTHQSLEGYATENWVQSQGYLTQHQDLSDYALKSEIPDISGLASETYVNNYTYDKATIDEKVAGGGTFDPTQYYNKTQTNELLDNKLDASAYTPCDLSNYYTKSETNNQISNATTDMATKTWVQSQGYLTQHQDLSNYALKSEIPDISGKQDISGMTAYTQITAFTAHAADTNVHVTQTEKNTWNNKVSQTTLNNYLLKSKIWCGTQQQYDAITTKDSETLYLIHS